MWVRVPFCPPALDKFEEELEFRDKLKEISLKQLEDTIEEDSKKHSLWTEIDEVIIFKCHQRSRNVHDAIMWLNKAGM